MTKRTICALVFVASGFVTSGLTSGAFAAPPPVALPVRTARAPARVLTTKAANKLMDRVAIREAKFYQPGVGFDGETGMTYDGHNVDWKTTELIGGPRTFSASSKESLHLILLTKAIEGEHTAELVISPDPKKPKLARASALKVLEKKIASYEQFDRDYPGYGGFFPWYKVGGGKVAPMDDWTDRVPGLDNGQLAWSIYLTANALKDAGEPALAARYQAHLDKMKANVVRIFYDPAAKKMRAESKLDKGNALLPTKNHYTNNVENYFLDDSYEGLLLCHFADMMGDWSKNPEGKNAIFATPRRIPATMGVGKDAVTTVRGHWFSAHEDWAYMVMPFRDVPIADRTFKTAQRARTWWSSTHDWEGLRASTGEPVKDNNLGNYLSAEGVTPLGKHPTEGPPVFAPYASFPLALMDKPMFATWLGRMLKEPGMFGKYGMGESFTPDGKHAPVLTWDGKATPIVAWMGGIGPDVGRLLKRDGLYDGFIARVEHDFSRFDHLKLKGEQLPLVPPPGTN